ncbi:hypothetical protein [Aquibaculum arenosum]|uniref:Secreted protein n=1 Tax=Aquibaculum arenosum TaxID=3032591 RepID=A0ABT5YP85_9PROT|nr:hypothetical protein [Fodinicurvata sp. CAU 1616]MDF2096786.1 hypothetical protein [Fodinicurvata sp. CAU 1616]
MTKSRLSALMWARQGAAVATLGLILAASGGADSSAEQSEPDAVSQSNKGAKAKHLSGNGPATVGSMTIDGQSYDLTASHWCEPEPGVENGSTVAIRVAALNDTGDVMVYALQVDRDRSRPGVQTVSAATDPQTNYRSGDVTPETRAEPMIVVENGAVRIEGDVRRSGGDQVPIVAEFSLPDEPGFPGYC